MQQPIPDDPIKSLAAALFSRIREEVLDWKQSSRLALHTQKYTLRPNYGVRYSIDPTITNFPVEEIEEQVWNAADLEQFIEEQIEHLPEYSELTRAVEEKGWRTAPIKPFARRVAYLCSTGVDAGGFEKHFETLIADLAGDQQIYHAKIFITGISLAESSMLISDSLVLRCPTREDVQEKVRGEMIHYTLAFRPYQCPFSCLADLHVPLSQPIDLQLYIDRLTIGLLLFRIGSVSAPQYEYESESFMSYGQARLTMPPRTERITYRLSREDASHLHLFLSAITPLIPSLYEVPQREPDFVSTALQWYGEALLASSPVQGAIASAIACLEALFLGDNPTTEITFRLVNRVACLLACLGWPPLEIREILMEAYGVRSKYVHGVSLSKKKGKRSPEQLLQKTAEYARVGCLIWLQLPRLHDRKETLNLIDKALVDDVCRRELIRRLNRIKFAQMPW